MYEQSFQLKSRPFTSTPFVNHYFPAQAIQKSLGSARLCIDRGAGPVIVIGEVGTGKSLLLAMLEEQYRTQFSVVNLVCSRLHERQELLQSILFELQLPYRNMSEGELRLSLMDYLKPSQACPNGALLLLDEAQNLPVDLLDEIRLITNYVRNGQLRVRLVMAGDQRLEEQLAGPKLESFNQRIAARCYLTALSQAETGDYVVTHIDRAGGGGKQMFGERSLRAIHELTEGCPRFINQLCEHALILAATNGRQVVDEPLVREAWADVQSLPGTLGSGSGSNWTAIGPTIPNVFEKDDNWTVIEFGSLNDDELKSNITPHNPFAQQGSTAQSSTSIAPPIEALVESHQFENFSDGSAVQMPPSENLDNFENTWEHSFESNIDSREEPDSKTKQEFLQVVESASNEENKYQSSASSTLNPFAETFDEEEQVIDRYAPLVAACNQAALRLSSEQLSCLKPLDQQTHDSFTPPIEQTVSLNQIQEPDVNHPIDAASQQEDSSSGRKYYSHSSEAVTVDVERQVEALINSLDRARYSLKTESKPAESVSHETEEQIDHQVFETLSFASEIAQSARVSFGNDAHDDVNQLPPIARPELESLHEVIEQQNRASANAFSCRVTEHEIEAPVPVLTPITRQFTLLPNTGRPTLATQNSSDRSLTINAGNDPTDDSDMIVINREEPTNSQPIRRVEPIPFPATPVSTGQAQRMDYQQLFAQLRNMPGE